MNKLWNIIRNVWNMVKSHVNIDIAPFFRDGVIDVIFLGFHFENNQWHEADLTILNINIAIHFSKRG